MKKEIKELEALGAKIEQVEGGLRLIGDWNSKYNDYHELFVEITGWLDTSHAVQHKDFLRGVTSVGNLDTSHAVQHEDFLRGVTSVGWLGTSDAVQHEDFLRGVTSVGSLYTSDAVQDKDFLRGVTSVGNLYTRHAVQDKDFLRGVTSVGTLYTNRAIQHEDFLKGSSNEFKLPMIYVDGILSEIHSTKVVDGVTVHNTTRVGYADTEYIATDGEHSAHASSVALSLADLRFKKEGRDTSWLEGKGLSDTLSLEDAVIAYRAVTGACSGGVDGFLRGRNQKKQYLISEIIEETRGQYGNEVFEKFFK